MDQQQNDEDGQQPQPQDNANLLEQLQEQNFDLQLTVATLEAEQKHALTNLQEETAKKESKLKAELRLALQDAQRWKAMAQQGRPKSIVGSNNNNMPAAMESSSSSNLPVAAAVPTKRPREEKEGLEMDEEQEAHPPTYHPQQPAAHQNMPPASTCIHPTSRLALNILTQTQQVIEDDDNSVAATTTTNQESSIRQVLASIAAAAANNKALNDSFIPTWSEEALIEWLIQQSLVANNNNNNNNNNNITAVPSPDRYYRMALNLSPACRSHVVQTVVAAANPDLDENDEANMDTTTDNGKVEGNDTTMQLDNHEKEGDTVQQETEESDPSRQPPLQFTKQPRIQLLTPPNAEDNTVQDLEALRKAMRDPFWTPNTSVSRKISSPPQNPSTDLLLQDFVRNLSTSMEPEHLQTLQNILGQAAATTTSNAIIDDDTTRNVIWWELCHDGLSTSIQRLILYRITHSSDFLRDVNGTKQEDAPNNESSAPKTRQIVPVKRPGSASGNKPQGRRRRLDKVKERLKKLSSSEGVVENVPKHEQCLALALSALTSLLRVTPTKTLQKWYEDHSGIVFDAKNPSFGGYAMVALLLELLEDLMFNQWTHWSSAMHADRIYCPGKNKGKLTPLTTAIPQWYQAVIHLLQRVGRTRGGMELLRTRAADTAVEDYMGNALDVSIRHLMSLSLHWDDIRLQDGAILRFDEDEEDKPPDESEDKSSSKEKESSTEKKFKAPTWWREERNAIIDSAEDWVRLWHQVLLVVQQSGGTADPINFRSLVLDLKDHYNSACAWLISSEDTRPEIRTMIQWQQEELALDEEDFEEWKDEQVRQAKEKADATEKGDGDSEMVL